MNWANISRRVLAAMILTALLIATTPALALALAPQESMNLMDCCKNGMCPMHPQNGEAMCGSMTDSSQDQYSMRACDAPANFALGIAPFLLIAPVAIHSVAPSLRIPPARSIDSQIVTNTPPSPPPRALLG